MITVLFEDSAAMLGLIVAFIGVAISDFYQLPIFDGIASLLISVILARMTEMSNEAIPSKIGSW